MVGQEAATKAVGDDLLTTLHSMWYKKAKGSRAKFSGKWFNLLLVS